MQSCFRTTFGLLACPLLFILMSVAIALYVVFGVVFKETIVHGRREAQCLVIGAELACPMTKKSYTEYSCWNIWVTYTKLRKLNDFTKITTNFIGALPTELDRCESFESCGNSSVACLYDPHNLKDVKVKEPYKLVVVVVLSILSCAVFLWAIFSFVVLLRTFLEERKLQDSGSSWSGLINARQRDIERRLDRQERAVETDTDSRHSSLDSLSSRDNCNFLCAFPLSPPQSDG